MERKQEIVPVRLEKTTVNHETSSQPKPKVAFQLIDSGNNRTIRVYNGIDKYILYSLLKGLNE